MGDDPEAGKGPPIDPGAGGVIGVPVGDDEGADWSVRPAANLLDVAVSGRWEIPGIDDEHRLLPDDDGGVALGKVRKRVLVLDDVDPWSDLLRAALRRLGARNRRGQGRQRQDTEEI